MVVVRIYQLRAVPGGGQSRNAIEMRVNHAIVIVVRAGMNVLKRREKKSQQESQADLQRNARAHFFDQSILPAPVLELRSRLEGCANLRSVCTFSPVGSASPTVC